MTRTQDIETATEPDLEWCHDAVQGVSRTFALTVDALEEPMDSHICVGYLLCRVADTVEDAGHIPPADQASLLDTYREAVDPDEPTTMMAFRSAVDQWMPAATDRNDDWSVVANAPAIAATFRTFPGEVRAAIIPPVLEMIGGMAQFLRRYAGEGGLRIQTQRELEEYCHYAAGTVGRLVTNLLTRDNLDAARHRTLRETAESFGMLLQLVNIAKDVYGDYVEEDNVYLPAEWLADEGVEQEAVVEPPNSNAVSKVVSRTVNHARSFLDDAGRYIRAMPLVQGNTVPAWGVPYLLAVGTLRELSHRPEDALTESGVAVSRAEVLAVLEVTKDADRASIPELRDTIAEQPFHTASQN